MNRKKTREATLKLLYETIVHKYQYEEVIDSFKENHLEEIPNAEKEIDLKYIERVIKGIVDNNSLLEEKIKANLVNRTINRISIINLAILKIAIYEMIFEEEIPTSVSINEAIELSKVYSDDKSPNFINGMLDSIVKSV
ncbi:MAG: transcription antitermination factor NusB [Clostridiaceae bacterium]